MAENKEYYISLLKEVSKKENRLPKKSDFSEEDVNKIKGLFGPWPWALAEAGLVESKKEARLQMNREKRLRSRLNKNKERGEST